MYNFLLVDDEPLIRKGTLKKIEKLKLPIQCVAEAANGKEAIRLLETRIIDFIITDMDMPEVDGIALLDYLKKNFSLMPIIVISGYENFDYVQKALQANAINYILKPFGRDDILKSINEVLAKLDSNSTLKISEQEMIVNSILGHKTPLASKLLYKQLDPLKVYHLVLLCKIHTKEAQVELLEPDTAFIASISTPQQQLFVAIVERTNLTLFSDKITPTFLCAISKEIEAFPDIHTNYLQCINALNSRNCQSSTIVEFIDEEFKNKSIFFEKTPEIIYLIEAGKAQLLEEKLAEYLQKKAATENVTLFELKKIGLSLIEKSKSLLDDFYHTESNYTLPKIYQEIMEQQFIFSDVLTYFITFLRNIAQAMSYEHLYSSSDTIKNVKDYLEKHFREPITLDLLADIFYINQSYLSVLFKEKTGVKYIDFLNRLRIEEAKNLLCTTDRKTAFIAKAVGYDNQKYFFRVFKKYTQTTPEKYRNEHWSR